MHLSSLRRAWRHVSAVAIVSAFVSFPLGAQQTQPTTTDSSKSKREVKLPMKMQMGTASQKKKTAASSKAKSSSAGKKPGPSTNVRSKSRVHMNMPTMSSKPDSAPTKMSGMAGEKRDSSTAAAKGMQQGMTMPHGHSTEGMMIGPAGVSMERMGSGTTWIPDAISMPSRRRMVGDWMVMAHGFLFAQYDKQNGERGDGQFGSLNWAMLMATHDLAGGRFQARTMLSVDPLTVTNRGYPLLLQSGESFNGQPLHDRQHPHDFWMELGALYQRQLTKSLAWSVYAAPSGEPALGPVAFMHRPSAMDNPTAPIGHHWQDATHVSFGVLTAGIFAHAWQLEGSVFNGREPDQNRWDFDPIRFDSYSARFTLNPNEHWSLAGGYGYLKSPEALNPGESIHRITASVQRGARLGNDGQWASAFIWGANKVSAVPGLSHSFLVESEAILDNTNTLFWRGELVQKSAEELVVDSPTLTSGGVLLPGFPGTLHFNVATAQLGYIRELARTHWATIGLGAVGTLNFVPSPLGPYYGSRTPVGALIFLRLRPFHTYKKGATEMGGMKMESGHE